MRFNIHEAKTQFSKLVAAVEGGERVTICRNGTPVIECIRATAPRPVPYGVWAHEDLSDHDLNHMVDPTDSDLLDEMGL
jgi:antitoxin (DNA-binding transcriptional repressor) of toxin-antitoxin stability system